MLAVQPFDLQGCEQRLRAGVIPAVALAAHRSGDAALLKQLAELMAGVLAAAIAMEDRPGTSIWTAVQPGHLQRIDDQMAAHLRLHRPAHHAAAEQVDDHGQEKPALVSWDLGDVASPRLVRRGHSEVAMQQVGRNRQTMSAIGGDAETPLAASADTVLPHQLLHPLLAHADALST